MKENLQELDDEKKNYNPIVSEEIKQRLSKIRHLALDMDGTIYLGNTIFPFTKDFLAMLDNMGVGYSFMTNNPTKSVSDYIDKLHGMGICATEDKMYTTSLATIDYIKTNYPEARKLFILGSESMISQFEHSGFVSCADSPEDVPDILVVAFDPTLVYSRFCRAAWWASKDIPYIATNPDAVCPTDERTIYIDCGSLCKSIENAVGRRPDVTLGKPDPNMLYGILQKQSLSRDEIAVVGDRIYTDIATANNAGVLGILVLTGETTPIMLEKMQDESVSCRKNFVPDLVVSDILELGRMIFDSKNIKMLNNY